MNKVENLRVAFTKIFEGRKKKEAGMTPLQKRASRDREAGNGLIDIGHQRRLRSKNLNRKYPGTKDAIPYRNDQASSSDKTAGDLFKGDPKTAKGILASRLAAFGSNTKIRAGALKKAKEYNREDSSTLNYRDSLRALFESVIEEMNIHESSAARKALVRAKLAAAGHKQNRLYKTQVKPQFKDQPYSTLPSTAKMARRDAKKVRGQLDPHDEKGRISLDGKREYVFDKAAELSSQSKAGKMARGMKRDYQDADEEQRREDARNDAEWEETDRDLSNFFRGGRSRGMFK